MNQRIAFGLATALTVFTLVVVSGIFSQLTQAASVGAAKAVEAAPIAISAPPPAPQPAIDNIVQEQIAQRESDYQKLLQQANDQLQRANERLQRADEQLQQANAQVQRANAQLEKTNSQTQLVAPQAKGVQPAVSPQAPIDAVAQPQFAVSVEQATAVALKTAAGSILMREPELVDFQGKVAYEVTLNRGLMYVDANSGQVLYDGTSAPQANSDGKHETGNAAPNSKPTAQTHSEEDDHQQEDEHHAEDQDSEDHHQEEHHQEDHHTDAEHHSETEHH